MARFLDTKRLHTYLDLAIKALKRREFDAIAFRGMSGAVAAPTIALALHKNLILVRKDEEKTHSTYVVEGCNSTLRYVIIDDFMVTGDTVRAIRKQVFKFAPQAQCIGVLAIQRLTQTNVNRYDRLALPFPLSRIPPKKGPVATK